ncbi:hypothetical protein [Bacillus sp. UNC438CL73TsuS30]|uniref:hypothetical protein n=1 Tax=Bacillus sp. UNC438CL73TsuS30 TaxID=1340434 RepID=UPI0004786AC2|nr:hypothetical protein [Bacillus sp. UNC438CL73TsuS30]
MKFVKNTVLIIIFTVILTSCDKAVFNNGCPDSIIEWVDVLMMNNIKYQHYFPEPGIEKVSVSLEKGKEIGKVTYKMADSACSDYQMKNGDAAYLEKGTPIYKLKGYPSSFIVVADNNIYVADQNGKAKTAGELYPLRGLVKNIHIESTEDGKRLYTFSAQSTDKFINAWYQLNLEGYHALQKKRSFEGERVFLEIELNNGATFRLLYWANTNTFNVGAVGNKAVREIIMNELSKIHKPS